MLYNHIKFDSKKTAYHEKTNMGNHLTTGIGHNGHYYRLLALKNDHACKTCCKTAASSAGLTLPAGFNANIIADNIGGARHIAVTPQGEIYVKLKGLEKGKGILLLHQNGDKAEIKTASAILAVPASRLKTVTCMLRLMRRCFVTN